MRDLAESTREYLSTAISWLTLLRIDRRYSVGSNDACAPQVIEPTSCSQRKPSNVRRSIQSPGRHAVSRVSFFALSYGG
jgi:hypothetical protein